ncbi:hypothetical protein C8Q75DRAFT_255523 [Abortiporus biennis]|nr:hypothetical protein C8Q75DRAFT_255523 [Abortiporus biennis]
MITYRPPFSLTHGSILIILFDLSMSSSITFPNELWLQILFSDALEHSDYYAIIQVCKRLAPIARPFLFSKMKIRICPDIEAIEREEVSFQTYIDKAEQRLDYFLANWATTVRSVSVVSTQFALYALDKVDPGEKMYTETRRKLINTVFDKITSFPNVETLHIDQFIIEQRYFKILENLPLKFLMFYRCLVKHRRATEDDDGFDDDDGFTSEEGDEDRFEDHDTYDPIEYQLQLPPSDFNIQHLRRIIIVENHLSPCVSTWQGLINPSTVEEIVTDQLCFPLLKVLRRLPLLPKLNTLRLPEVALMHGQIDALKDTLTKCPNLIYLELAWFAGSSDDIPVTISPDAVPKLKHITVHLNDVLNFLPHRPIESITVMNPLTFGDGAVQSIVQASHKAPQLRRLKFTYCVNADEEKAALESLGELFTSFPLLEEFLLTMDSCVSENFAHTICELIATHTIHTRIRVFKYYFAIPGRYSSWTHQESERRRLDGLHCDNHLTKQLRSCCPKLEIVVVEERAE